MLIRGGIATEGLLALRFLLGLFEASLFPGKQDAL